jgi:hypothetical protein
VETVIWVGVGLVVVVAVFLGLPWAADRMVRSSGGSGGGANALGVLQEIFHPAAHRADSSIVQEQERKAPIEAGEDEDPVHRPDAD